MTPEERRQRLQAEEERLRQIAEQNRQQEAADNVVSEEPQVNRDEIREAAQTAEPQEQTRGNVTEFGETMEYLAMGGAFQDTVNAIAAGANYLSGGRLQELDDKVLGSQEMKDLSLRVAEEQAQRRAAGEMSAAEQINDTLRNAQIGTVYGGASGVALPVTAVAGVTGQDAPWSRRPEVLKDSPVGESLFTISEIVVPTLLYRGPAAAGARAVGLGRVGGAAATAATGLIAGSAVETVQQQDGISEQLGGRRVAEEIGVIAEHYGLVEDGAVLARDLVENKTGTAKSVNFVVNMLMNMGFNIGVDQITKVIVGPAWRAIRRTPEVEKTAEVLRRNPEKVADAIEDVSRPAYRSNAEPGDVLTVDDAVPVSRPTQTYISEPAQVAEALRRSGIGEDGLTAADRKFFTNWEAVTRNDQLQDVLRESTKTLRRLKDFPDDIKLVQNRALSWWDKNKELMDNNIDALGLNYQSGMTETMSEYRGASAFVKPDDLLREYSVVKPEGFIATALVAEELGIRMQRLAIQARNLENAKGGAIDFTNVVEQLATLHDKSSMFLIPWRRAKRKWAVEGMVQQRRSIEGLKDADVRSATRTKDPTSYLEDSSKFDRIKVDELDEGNSFRELWEAYQAGDQAAGKTLKTYIDTISAVSPESVIGAADNLTGVLKAQIKKANMDASSQLYYQYLLTTLRPQVASAGSNIARLVMDPLGSMISLNGKERAYGIGQFVGGFAALGDAASVAWNTMRNGAMNSGTKLEHIADINKQLANEDKLFENVMRQLNTEGRPWYDKWAATVNHMRRQLAFHPMSNIATRGLQAGDEASKAVFASQVATGRAYQSAARNGSWDNVGELITDEMNKVFRDGVKTGKIIDEDVLDGAKTLTFQNDIPTDGNFVDNMFLAAQRATETSGVWRFFNPFPRMTYNTLEQGGRYMFGMLPGGGQLMGKMMPRYQRILSGQMGEVAQLQFRSHLNQAKVLAGSAIGLASFGFMTGNNSGDMPKTSFIIPANNKEGYIAIDYGRLEPFTMPLSLMADLVSAVKNEVMTQGDYDKALKGLIYSLGMASTDKSFAMGIQQLSALLNVKNFGEGTIGSIAGSGGSLVASQLPIVGGAPGGVIRNVMRIMQPYQTIQSDEGNILATLWAKASNRLFGGIAVPIKYDELTGEPIPRVATLGEKDDHWAASAGSLLNEAVFPGRITNADKDNPIKMQLRQLGYSKDMATSNRYYDGQPLTLEQQSQMGRAMYEEGLPRELQALFDNPQFIKAVNRFNQLRGNTPLGDVKEGTEAYEQMQNIHRSIDRVYRNVKTRAARRVLYSGRSQASASPERSSLPDQVNNIIARVPG